MSAWSVTRSSRRVNRVVQVVMDALDEAMQGGDVVGTRVLVGAGCGRKWDADELLSMRRRSVRREGVGIEENEVVCRWRSGIRVLNIGRVHKYQGLETIRCLDFGVAMKVRRHGMMFSFLFFTMNPGSLNQPI